MLTELLETLKKHDQRGMLWLTGSREWTSKWLEWQLSTISLDVIDNSAQLEQSAAAKLGSDKGVYSAVRFTDQSDDGTSFNRLHDARTKQYKRYLGQDLDIVIYDGFSGFNPDAFGGLAGTVKLGGLFILVTPPENQWPSYTDPELNRVCVEPYQYDQIPHGYLARLTTILSQDPSVIRVNQPENDRPEKNQPEKSLPFETGQEPLTNISSIFSQLSASKVKPSKKSDQPTRFASQDQKKAVQTVLENYQHDRSVSILTADRGRGKSTSLAFVAADLIKAESDKRGSEANSDPEEIPLTIEQTKTVDDFTLIITCPLSDSVATFFRHLKAELEQQFTVHEETNGLSGFFENGRCWQVSFMAPDQLLSDKPQAELLLIDEAAAIPQILLQPLFTRYNHLVLATTIHGYEGTGRGFEYKLKPQILAEFDHVALYHLSTPIRWHQDDHLEPIVNRMLGLDIELTNFNSATLQTRRPIAETLEITKIEKSALWHDIPLSDQIFGLLVQAHYRTSPNDLRMLLDSPNIDVWVARNKDNIVAAAMVAMEGLIEASLAEQIWQGRRRPRGHLFPQSLLNHSGFKEAGKYSYGRIVRIAVSPERQSQQIGSGLVAKIKADLMALNIDFICTSFGLSLPLLRFWQKSGLAVVRLGMKPEASTGELSLMMWQSLSTNSEAMFTKATSRFAQGWPIERQFIASRQGSKHLSMVFDKLLSCDKKQDWTKTEHATNLVLNCQDSLDLEVVSEHFRLAEHAILAIYKLAHVTDADDILRDWLVTKIPLPEVKKARQINSIKQWNLTIKEAVCNRMDNMLNAT